MAQLPNRNAAEQNPYAASATAALAPWQPDHQRRPQLCTVLFIIDLLLCGVQATHAYFHFQTLAAVRAGTVVTLLPVWLLWLGAIASPAIALLGVPANILLLMNKRIGLLLGYASLAGALVSLAIAGVETCLVIAQAGQSEGEVEPVVARIVVLIVRLSLTGLYLAALLRFAAWQRTISPARF